MQLETVRDEPRRPRTRAWVKQEESKGRRRPHTRSWIKQQGITLVAPNSTTPRSSQGLRGVLKGRKKSNERSPARQKDHTQHSGGITTQRGGDSGPPASKGYPAKQPRGSRRQTEVTITSQPPASPKSDTVTRRRFATKPGRAKKQPRSRQQREGISTEQPLQRTGAGQSQVSLYDIFVRVCRYV